MKTTLIGAIAFSLCLGDAAQAVPRTINDCEKIEAADAYNQCLALFGPPAHSGYAGGQDGAEGRSMRQVEPQEDVQPTETETPARNGRHQARQASRHDHHHSSGRHYAHHGRHRHVSVNLLLNTPT